MQRRADGVILVEAHTNGGPIQFSVENHRSVGQMLKTVGADPENEIMIFTGSGDEFMMDADPEGFKLEAEDLPYWAYEDAYKDGRINVAKAVAPPCLERNAPLSGSFVSPPGSYQACRPVFDAPPQEHRLPQNAVHSRNRG